MIQFFAPDIVENPVLPKEESRHAVRVLRMQCGDEVTVVDGRGNRYRCTMLDPHPDHALVAIRETIAVERPWPCHITLAIAPTKHMDRMEWLVEKLVEIGINRIVPLRCMHSERKEIKLERLQKIAVSALKQSLKAEMPELTEIVPMQKFLAQDFGEAELFVCYCDDATPRRDFARTCTPGADVVILIGPEGDFAPEEIQKAMERGFVPVTLGEQRLRTETAALFAVSAVHVINQITPLGGCKS